MTGLFYNCSSLIFIPNISNWKTNKMEDISLMFYNFTCTLLISIPDIFKWNKHNLKFMSKLFYNCSSLMPFSAIFELDIPSDYDISE